MRGARSLVAALVLALTLGGSSLADDGPRRLLGLPLADALGELQAQGMRIIYSSDLVRPEMRVQAEPTAVWLHEVLAQLLAPHGLAARVGPGGSLLVVRAGPAPVVVRLTTPTSGEVTTGEVPVAAEVTASEPVASVDFFINGWPVARVREPPYRARVNVPDETGDCRFTAVARTTTGARGSDSVVTKRVVLQDRVEVALRQVYVNVVGSWLRDRPLEQSDFHLLDGGLEQPLASFGRGDAPLSALLLIDASESMRGAALTDAFRAARAFLARLGSEDEVAALVFSDRVLALTPFGAPDPTLLAGLERSPAGGGTALNDHLYAALRLLDERPGRRVVVLLSDGADVSSVLTAEDVLWKVRHSDAAIYWLRLNLPPPGTGFTSSWRDVAGNAREEEGLLAAIAESGGRSEPLAAPQDLERAFTNVVAELRQEYVLGYYPKDLHRDGTWRPLEIRTDAFGVRLRYRGGWVDR